MIRRKATKAESLLRVEDVLRLRLDGNEFWEIAQHIASREKEPGNCWTAAEGEGHLGDRQIWEYIEKADKLMVGKMDERVDQLRLQHIARRYVLYTKAVRAREYKTGLAILQDIARLLDLYPKVEHELVRDLKALREELDTLIASERAGVPPAAGAVPQGTT